MVKIIKQAKAEDTSSEDDDEIRIGVVKVKLARGETNEYQLATETIYHMTNERNHLIDV